MTEHIGQAEADFNCKPVTSQPLAQEKKRNDFIKELFRVAKSGDISLHTVDHAARNLSYVDNFLEAGWLFMDPNSVVPSVDSCLNDKDAVRQEVHWTKPNEKMKNQELHSCLFMGFYKP